MDDELKDATLPSWIAKRKQEKVEQDRAAEQGRREQLGTSMSIQAGGPEFWSKLLASLSLNVQALPELPDDELVGTVSAKPSGHELSYHIQVNRQSVRRGPALSTMNLWYKPGGYRVRRWYQNSQMPDIELEAGRDGVVAVLDGSHPMTPQELGDHIIRWMAKRVRVA